MKINIILLLLSIFLSGCKNTEVNLVSSFTENIEKSLNCIKEIESQIQRGNEKESWDPRVDLLDYLTKAESDLEKMSQDSVQYKNLDIMNRDLISLKQSAKKYLTNSTL